MQTDTYLDRSSDARTRAQDLRRLLTLREKVGQLNQSLYGFQCYEKTTGDIRLSDDFYDAVKHWGGLGVLYGLYRSDPWTKKDQTTGLNKQEMVSLYNKVQEAVITSSRFSIPVMFSQESPHGPVQLDSYMLPVNLAAGSSFNPALYAEACAVAGQELHESGVHLALVSMLDLARDPRWGRSEECYSEDPFLAARMSGAGVEGYRRSGTEVVAKHYVAHGEGTGGINAAAVSVSEYDLHDIHLQAVQSAVDAGAAGIMAAYNEINGIFCHASEYMLRDLLRTETGFDGIVMADGIAVDNLNLMTGDPVESGALALRAGVNVSLWDEAFTRLEEACERHPELEALIDEACDRVLELKFKTGLYDNPFLTAEAVPDFSAGRYPQSLDLARESIVLLKNNNHVLPLKKSEGKSLAVIGPHARDIYTLCGDYTPYLNPERTISLAEGLSRFAPVQAEEGCGIRRRDSSALERAKDIAGFADAVILTVGGSSSRFGDSTFEDNGAISGILGDVDCGEGADVADISISASQMELFREVREITKHRNVPLITVVIAGRAYAIAEITEQTDALLYSFYPGPMGGQAIAEVIFGAAPAGRLPVTLPKSNLQIPCYYNRKASYRHSYTDLNGESLYEFGSGLTYTEFELAGVDLSASKLSEGEILELSVKIKNAGDVRAAAVPQLYIRRLQSSRAPRVRELKGFTKQFIDPGEVGTIPLRLHAKDVQVWTSNRKWELEAGPLALEIRDQGKVLWTGTIEIRT